MLAVSPGGYDIGVMPKILLQVRSSRLKLCIFHEELSYNPNNIVVVAVLSLNIFSQMKITL
jgi:hypothetical protein